MQVVPPINGRETPRPGSGARVPRRPLRVMHLVYKLAGGGMEHNVVKLANAHDRSRVLPSICSCQPADSLKELLHPSVPLIELTRRPGNDLRFVVQLIRLLSRERPDILHTHSWGTLGEGFIAARVARVGAIVHGEHGTMETGRFNLRVQRYLWRRVDRVLSVSSRLTERLATEVGFQQDRITVIRNGADLSRLTGGDRSAVRDEFGLRPGELTIGTIGRLEPVKDHETLLTALTRVRDNGLPFKALIVGDGSLRQTLQRRAADLGLEAFVRFTGARSDVEHLLAAMDLFVMPSRSEGLSNTIIEAMAAGLPIVATDVGGTDELITHDVTGRLVPPEHSAILADAMTALLKNPFDRARLGSAAQGRAIVEFGLDRMVRQYEELYLDVSSGRPMSFARESNVSVPESRNRFSAQIYPFR